MLHVLIGSATALLVGLLITPLFRRLAHRLNITDRPDAKLKPHARPIAYLGGVAFYLAWLAGLAVVQLLAPGWVDYRVWLIAGVAAIMLGVGLADDIHGISPHLRLLGEAIAAALLFVGGARYLGVPLLPAGWPVLAVAFLVHIILVAGACNSTNLLDGLDGLCGGVTTIVLLGLAGLASLAVLASRAVFGPGLAIGLSEADLARLRLVIVLALPMAAALLAFLRYNYRPASIFMGDAGSLLLGFVVASCLIMLGVPDWLGMTLLFGGLMTFGLPIGDTMLAFIRRAINHRPIFIGDRSHFYDQLVDRGLPVTRVVKTCYLLAVGFVIVGWFGAIVLAGAVRGWQGYTLSMAFYLLVIAAIVTMLRRHGFVRVDAS